MRIIEGGFLDEEILANVDFVAVGDRICGNNCNC